MHSTIFRVSLLFIFLIMRSGFVVADSANTPNESKQRISIAFSNANHSGNSSQIIVSRMLSALATPKALNPQKRPAVFEVSVSWNKSIDTLIHLYGAVAMKYIGQLDDYYGINLSNFMMPDSIEIRGKAPDGKSLFNSIIALDGDTCLFFKSLNVETQIGSVIVTRLIFSERTLVRFEKALTAINNYLAWDKLLPFLTERNQSYSDDCLDEFVDWYIMTIRSKVGSSFSKLDDPGFRKQDPLNLLDRSRKFEGDCYRRWLHLEKSACLRDGGGQFKPEGIAKNRIANNVRELIAHPYYTDPHAHSLLKELSIIESNRQGRNDSLSFVRLFGLVCPDCDSTLLNRFIDENIRLLADSLSTYLQRGRFSEAEIWAQNNVTLSQIRGLEEGIDRAYQSLSEVHNGILDSWLKVATKALRLGSLEMSIRYIKMAGEYAKKYPRTLIADDAIKSVVTALVDTSLNRAQKLRAQNQSDKALVLLDQVIPLADSLEQFTRKDQLKMVYCLIAQDHYDHLLNKSLSLITSNKISAGAGFADEALNYRFENRQVLTKRGEEQLILKHLALYKIDTLVKRSYNNVKLDRLIQVLDSSYYCFNAMAPLKADTLYPYFSKLVLQFSMIFPDSVNKMIDNDNYSLATYWVNAIRTRVPAFIPFADSSVVSVLNTSLEELESGACVMSRDAFQRSIMKAEDLSIQKRYREAFSFFTVAASHLAAVLQCHADTSSYFALNRKFGVRWNFSNRQFLMDSLMRQGDVVSALSIYDSLYQQRKRSSTLMSEFYIQSDVEMIVSYRDPLLIDTLVNRMIKRDQPEGVFEALESLRAIGVVDSLYAPIQVLLGRFLAKPYEEGSSTEQLVMLMKGYKMGDPYYKQLRDTFLDRVNVSTISKKYLKARTKF
jgi:hypothetical protein